MTICCPMCKSFARCEKRRARHNRSCWEACCDGCSLFYTACPDLPILRRRGWFRINDVAWRAHPPPPPTPPASAGPRNRET